LRDGRTWCFAENLRRLKLELERDGYAADGRITLDTLDKRLDNIAFTVENRTGNAHRVGLGLSFPANSEYELREADRAVPLAQTGNWDYPWRAELSMSAPTAQVELVRMRDTGN
jgi:hypothetical protein